MLNNFSKTFHATGSRVSHLLIVLTSNFLLRDSSATLHIKLYPTFIHELSAQNLKVFPILKIFFGKLCALTETFFTQTKKYVSGTRKAILKKYQL